MVLHLLYLNYLLIENQIYGKIIIRSILDRTLFVLLRAIQVAIPAGFVIWIFANININGLSILSIIANFLDPFASIMGLDGVILAAFIFGMPANEIVLPIILMCYLGRTSLTDFYDYASIRQILIQNNWTLLTIKKETASWKWTALSFILPTICGIIICILINYIFKFITI